MSAESDGVNRTWRHTWQILSFGFAIIASLFIAQDLITRHFSSSIEQRSRRVERDSLSRINAVNRINRDAMQIALLVNEHIYETSPSIMASIEKNIDALLLDIDNGSRAYEPLVELPEEARTWDKARGLIEMFRVNVARALELSRVNRNVEARAWWTASNATYSDLGPTLTALVALNQQASLN